MRFVPRILVGLVALLLLVVLAGYLGVRGSLPGLDGERQVAGIESDVVIERDALAP